jgi:hypothetical protein
VWWRLSALKAACKDAVTCREHPYSSSATTMPWNAPQKYDKMLSCCLLQCSKSMTTAYALPAVACKCFVCSRLSVDLLLQWLVAH